MMLRPFRDRIFIDRIVTHGPAAKAGIRHHSYLLEVDGAPTAGRPLTEVVEMLRGPVGADVVVTVRRHEEDIEKHVLTREVVDFAWRECLAGDCEDGHGERVNAFGERYVGTFRGGAFHGEGRFTSPGGRTYEGGWAEGEASGPGVEVDAWGTRTEGHFERGYPKGLIKRTYPGGVVYEGAVVGYDATGPGRVTLPNGDVKEGEFVDDRFVSGTWRRDPKSDGRTCAWQVAESRRTGVGTIRYAADDPQLRVSFEGAVADDCTANGAGVMWYADRKTARGAERKPTRKVEGEFVADAPAPAKRP